MTASMPDSSVALAQAVRALYAAGLLDYRPTGWTT